MNPAVIVAALEAVTVIIQQISVYSRGQMTDAEMTVFHERVMAFMRAVQKDADTLR